MRSGSRHRGEAGGGWSGFPPLLATDGRIHKGDCEMTGAIFARGSCVALKWMTLLGAVLALTVAEAAAQQDVTLTMTGEYKPSTNTIELEFAGFDAGDTLYSSSAELFGGLVRHHQHRHGRDGGGDQYLVGRRGEGQWWQDGHTYPRQKPRQYAERRRHKAECVVHESTPARRILVMDADGAGESDDDIAADIGAAVPLEEIDVPPVLAPVPNKNYTVDVAIASVDPASGNRRQHPDDHVRTRRTVQRRFPSGTRVQSDFPGIERDADRSRRIHCLL